MSDVVISKNESESRYEAKIDGEVIGLIDYSDSGKIVILPHTEVDKEYGGQGIAGELTKFALEDIRSMDKQVAPTCPYVHHYIEKHAEYGDMVA